MQVSIYLRHYKSCIGKDNDDKSNDVYNYQCVYNTKTDNNGFNADKTNKNEFYNADEIVTRILEKIRLQYNTADTLYRDIQLYDIIKLGGTFNILTEQGWENYHSYNCELSNRKQLDNKDDDNDNLDNLDNDNKDLNNIDNIDYNLFNYSNYTNYVLNNEWIHKFLSDCKTCNSLNSTVVKCYRCDIYTCLNCMIFCEDPSCMECFCPDCYIPDKIHK